MSPLPHQRRRAPGIPGERTGGWPTTDHVAKAHGVVNLDGCKHERNDTLGINKKQYTKHRISVTLRLMPDSTSPAASHRLRQAMSLRGIGSAAELARLTNHNEVTVRSHVNGTRDVSKRAAEAYSRALNIDPAWLLYGHGPAPDASRRMPRSDPGTEPPMSSETDRNDDIGGTPNARPSLSEAPDFHF